MLLRRVIAHFRKQEWTAIALDFLIVVIGVLSEIGPCEFKKMALSAEFRSSANYLRELQLFFLRWEEGSLEHIRSIRENLARQMPATEPAP